MAPPKAASRWRTLKRCAPLVLLREHERLEHIRTCLVIVASQAQEVFGRNKPSELRLFVEYCQMEDTVLVHEAHTLIDSSVRRHGNQVHGHDFGRAHPGRTLVLRYHLL